MNARSLILESFLQWKIYIAWIFCAVHGIPELSPIMLVVLVMANATVSSAQSSVSASEIVAKVQNNQPIESDNVTISRDLDVGRLNPTRSAASFQ